MDRFFQLSANKTSIRQEAVAGLTTFLAMAYILFVNPDILGAAGMDQGAVFVATALAAMVGSIIMGLIANYPIALAPGMGLNAFFAYTVVINYGMSWQAALFAVFASGVIFIFITIFKLREKIINAIPEELKYAAGAGIGLFIAFIGLKNAGIVVGDEATLVTMGNLQSPGTLLAIFGIVITIVLVVMNIKGAVFYGLALTALAGILTGMNSLDGGILSMPPSLTTFGAAFQFESWTDEIFTLQMLIVILTFLFIVFFDTAGTLFAVATQAGFVKDNRLPRAGRALFADASATTVGAVFGTSTTTAYVESTSGVAVGGRTGLTAIFTGLFFLVALFFSPLLSVITEQVTAPALIVVGVMMATSLRHIDWNKMEIAVPVFFTVVTMPLTYSIATGIALGFVLYPLTMVVKGRGKELHPLMYLLFVAFVLFLFFLPH
ncbi:NCS2 family permease [Shouchella sp. 1P09AA]|uniref:NCS2 family permease n=1 Tax=unclassified Shouchella TaxID=2893065 RepID=UPI00399F0064